MEMFVHFGLVDKMVHVDFNPITKVVVHDVAHVSKEELVYSMGHGVEAGNFGRSLYWADGMAFAYSTLPWGDQTIREYINGTIHINSLIFSEWPEYVHFHEIEKSKIRIPLWDISNQPSGFILGRFCKKYAESEKKK